MIVTVDKFFTWNRLLVLLTFAAFAVAAMTTSAWADESEDAAAEQSDDQAEEKKDEPKTIAEVVENCDHIEGLFTLYRDQKDGKVYLLVRKDQLEKEFIYFTYTENGLSPLRQFRGNYRDARVFTIERDYQRLRFVFRPTRYHFSPDSALSKAAAANIVPAVLAAEEIVATDEETGEYLVVADNIFLAESFQQIKDSDDPSDKGKSFKLGELSSDKTRYASVQSYPKNTDFVVDYVYDNPRPATTLPEGTGMTDPRYVTITMQHSLVEMPENDYQSRSYDGRVGYFSQQVDDMTSTEAAPFRDLIERWHLIKKDPSAAVSAPVEPIVWWLENSTPEEFRGVIQEAILSWNGAFEQAGFKDAIEVRIQPDDASWEAGDMRYNVIRWTSSPAPVFGGYGPSFVNPRTGQILGADIMLEWIFVTNRVKYRRIYEATGSWNVTGPQHTASGRGCSCCLAQPLQMSTMLGRQVLASQSMGPVDVNTLIRESLYYLVMHEVGHTFGLSHNFRSSQLRTPQSIHDKELTEREGLVGSVMDYPTINLAPAGQTQGQYYTTTPGPYDRWAIEYGYSTAEAEPAAEDQRLAAILSRSTRPELAFANDADDMRTPGYGIDPRAMIGDLTSDVVSWGAGHLQLIRETTQKLLENYNEPGKSYHELRDSYFVLLKHYRSTAATVSRYVGGVYVDRAWVGQEGATQPFRPIARAEQKQAMQVLSRYVFAPDSFPISPQLMASMQDQRRGFNLYASNGDVQIHKQILRTQQSILDHLLHPSVLARISDTSLYGNEYPLSEFFTDLTAAVFQNNLTGKNRSLQRNLQIEYVNRLVTIGNGETVSVVTRDPILLWPTSQSQRGFDYQSQSTALYQLRRIRKQATTRNARNQDAATIAHQEHLRLIIDRAVAVTGKR